MDSREYPTYVDKSRTAGFPATAKMYSLISIGVQERERLGKLTASAGGLRPSHNSVVAVSSASSSFSSREPNHPRGHDRRASDRHDRHHESARRDSVCNRASVSIRNPARTDSTTPKPPTISVGCAYHIATFSASPGSVTPMLVVVSRPNRLLKVAIIVFLPSSVLLCIPRHLQTSHSPLPHQLLMPLLLSLIPTLLRKWPTLLLHHPSLKMFLNRLLWNLIPNLHLWTTSSLQRRLP